MKNFVDLLARILLATIFFYEAYDAIFFADATKTAMAAHRLTWNADMLLRGGTFVLVLGAVLLLIGYRVALGVTLLLMYLIPTTFIAHAFWTVPLDCTAMATCLEGEEIYRRMQAIMFMKNLAIIGGLLVVWVNGSGKWSVKRLFATTKVRTL
ncbi:MAG: putative oxidoreductase [Paraglaciecola sp.]|jgi:putative oxidoreductase